MSQLDMSTTEPAYELSAAVRRRGLLFLGLAVGAAGLAMGIQMGLNANFLVEEIGVSGLQMGGIEAVREICGITALVILAIFLVIGLASMANRIYKEQQFPPAVIVAQEVDVTSGPGDSKQYLVEFNLHAGAEVSLLEHRPGWRRVTLPGDLQGWVPREAVELVIDEGE